MKGYDSARMENRPKVDLLFLCVYPYQSEGPPFPSLYVLALSTFSQVATSIPQHCCVSSWVSAQSGKKTQQESQPL